MEEILHHLAVQNPVNNGINFESTGAGILPSTVLPMMVIRTTEGNNNSFQDAFIKRNIQEFTAKCRTKIGDHSPLQLLPKWLTRWWFQPI